MVLRSPLYVKAGACAMVMDWEDRFTYGIYQHYQVGLVWRMKPSYLVWTTIYTQHRFVPEITEAIQEYVRRGPKGSLTETLVNRFNEKYGAPW